MSFFLFIIYRETKTCILQNFKVKKKLKIDLRVFIRRDAINHVSIILTTSPLSISKLYFLLNTFLPLREQDTE